VRRGAVADLLPLLPGFEAMAAVHVVDERVSHERVDAQHAIVENNLARKGVWLTDPERSSGSIRDALHFETEDVVGQLIMDSSMGRLSTTEMELVSWVFARWMGQEIRTDAFIHTSLREIAEAFETVWGGSRARFIKDMLRRIHEASVLVCIISDGQENSSTDYTYASVAERIQRLSDTERWTFTYLGSNQDLSAVSDSLSISMANTSSYAASREGTTDAWKRHSRATRRRMQGVSTGKHTSHDFYAEDLDLSEQGMAEPEGKDS
jgi:hypothetical protein